jgi:hypothetical protein
VEIGDQRHSHPLIIERISFPKAPSVLRDFARRNGWPASAHTLGDAGGTGYSASAQFISCEVSEDGTQRCTNLCKSSEYALSCFHESAPDSLDCRVLPLPTPAGETVYCCRCD